MNQIFFSLKLLIYGIFCSVCVFFCTYFAEKCVVKNKALNKKLLTFMSNFSDNNLNKWQNMEKKFLRRYPGDISSDSP